ncbi:MAG: CZB domain-containing protein [Magnetococcales bacterium]|nr:CZB domain-containing protein [Magnetococcales bacterium]
MKQVDLGIARMAHVLWESELEEMVQKHRKTIHLTSHEDCELGLWLHGEGIRELYHLDPVRRLVGVHEQFHQAADRLVSMISMGAEENIEREMNRVRGLSRDIVYFITEAELDYLEHKPLSDFSAHPFKSFIHRLFNIHLPDPGEIEKRGVLEVSHARLMHLRWSRQLLRAFQHWGKDASLESSDLCSVGIWIHEVGLKHKEIIDIVQELDDRHQLFHTKAEETIRLLRRKNFRRSEELFNEVTNLGREVLYLLTRIELLLLQSGEVDSPINILKHP